MFKQPLDLRNWSPVPIIEWEERGAEFEARCGNLEKAIQSTLHQGKPALHLLHVTIAWDVLKSKHTRTPECKDTYIQTYTSKVLFVCSVHEKVVIPSCKSKISTAIIWLVGTSGKPANARV